jgi:hypothetical protein
MTKKKKSKEKRKDSPDPLERISNFLKSQDFFGISIPPFNIKG